METLTEERSKIRNRIDSIYKKRMSLFSISISRVYSQQKCIFILQYELQTLSRFVS
jgi:hypothetical protein